MQDPPPWRGKSRRPWTPAEKAELFALTEQVRALSQTPAGPKLCAALAAVDVDRLPESLLVDLLLARTRQLNHDQGQQLVMAMRIMACDVPGGKPIGKTPPLKLVQGAIDEIRAALTHTRTAATTLCRLSWDVHHRLPEVLAAMLTGSLDKPRAVVFSTWTAELSPEHTAAVVAQLLPVAPDLTTSELRDQIAKQAIALDPEWVRRRYERALQGRRVEGKRNPDGTATLTGHDLPLDEVAAACARLDALAHAAKAAGHADRLDHLRADLLVGMITGRYTSMTDQHILADLLATATAKQNTTTQPNPTTSNTNDDRDHDDPDDSGLGDDDPDDIGLGDDGLGDDDDDPDGNGPGDDDLGDDLDDDPGDDDGGPDDDDPDDDDPDGDCRGEDDPCDDSPSDDDLDDDGPDDGGLGGDDPGDDPGDDNPGDNDPDDNGSDGAGRVDGPPDAGGTEQRPDSDGPDGIARMGMPRATRLRAVTAAPTKARTVMSAATADPTMTPPTMTPSMRIQQPTAPQTAMTLTAMAQPAGIQTTEIRRRMTVTTTTRTAGNQTAKAPTQTAGNQTATTPTQTVMAPGPGRGGLGSGPGCGYGWG